MNKAISKHKDKKESKKKKKRGRKTDKEYKCN